MGSTQGDPPGVTVREAAEYAPYATQDKGPEDSDPLHSEDFIRRTRSIVTMALATCTKREEPRLFDTED